MPSVFCVGLGRRSGFAVLVLLVTLFGAINISAQTSGGTVAGSASDPQNAAVPDVMVVLTNQDTGVVQSALTNDSGFFRISGVEPGDYLVEFTKTGFQTVKSSTIAVTASKETTVNASMLVGVPSTQVFVTVNGMELDKTIASIRLTLPAELLDEIPLSSSSLVPGGARNFARYPLLSPGVARVLFQNETSANGHRGRENNYMLDGGDNNDQTVTLPAIFTPPEAIREVDVQASAFSAEFGRNLGAQVNVVTRSGTNTFRGELWEFYRGNALEPLSLVSRKAGQTNAPRLVDNQFGGSIGGPIVQRRTFFFGMVQANRQRTGPRPQASVTIPSPAGYAALQNIPLRTAPTPQATASRQAILQALSFLPEVHSQIRNYDSMQTTTVNDVPIELGTFRPVIPSRQDLWYGAIRVDHQLGETGRLTYRAHIDRRNTPLASGNLQFGERWGADNKYNGQNHLVGFLWSPTSTFINEARVSYARLFPSFVERDPVSPTVNITNLFQIGGSAGFPQERTEQTYQFQNVSTLIVSRHALRFGFDLARTRLDSNSAANSKGTWSFSSLQNFLNSQATSLVFLASAPTRYQFDQLRQAYFLQDDIKATRNLTVNLGLRYETSAVPLGFFGATLPEVQAIGVPGPVQRDTNNWGPRAGFAYSPSAGGRLGRLLGDGQSSIRGGFGVGYDVLFYSILANTAGNYPRTDTQSLTGSNAPIDVFPAIPPKVSTPTLNAGSTYVNVPSNARQPTSQYWTLSIQRQLSQSYRLELGYSGNRSYFLLQQGQANPGILSPEKASAVIAGCTGSNLSTCQDPAGFATSPSRLNPAWGSRVLIETGGKAAYNSGYLQLDGRTQWGFRFGLNYTLSANFSDSEEYSADGTGSSDGGLSGSSPQVPQDYLNRRNEWSRSVFDRPHRFTVNYNYDIPWFRSSPDILEHVFGGWRLSGFTELQSGQPFTIRLGVDALGTGTTSGARPNYNPGGTISKDPTTNNLRTFVIPLDGSGIVTAPFVRNASTGTITFLKNSMPAGGNLGRNTFRGPGYANFSLSLMKRILILGDRELQIRGDFTNLFNHDNFPNPDNNMSSSTFGRQTFNPLTDARQVLLGAKLKF